jgi:hypothetical protein
MSVPLVHADPPPDTAFSAQRRLLTVASVQGQEFDSVVVARALEIDAAEVEEQLEVLERVHLFVRKIGEHEFPDSQLTLRCVFVHALYQNALYGTLAPARRTSLSAAVPDLPRNAGPGDCPSARYRECSSGRRDGHGRGARQRPREPVTRLPRTRRARPGY